MELRAGREQADTGELTSCFSQEQLGLCAEQAYPHVCVCVCVSLNRVCLLETSLQAWKRVMIEKRKDVDSTRLAEITLCDN